MAKFSSCFFSFVFLLFIFCVNVYPQNRSTISGVIYNEKSNRPVPEIYVELQNEYYSTLLRIKTDNSGRYIFKNLSRGSYKIKVSAFDTDYIEQTQDAQVVTFVNSNGETPDNVYLDFYLKLKPGVGTENKSTGVVFVQEIPDNARNLYKKGVEQLAEKKDIGIENIEQSISLFPAYYEALDFLGGELVKRQLYKRAIPFLVKAIDVNKRSFSSFYALGYACYKLDFKTEAIEAFRAATILSKQSINAHLFYGITLRLDKQYQKSENELLQAKTLAKETPVAEIHWQLGLLYNRLNRNKEAADELEIFLKLSPNAPEAAKVRELIIKLRSSN
jgi:hypothetical protein